MTYKFDLEQDFEREPFCTAFGDEIIRFMLGEDAEAQIMLFMTVRLNRKEEDVYDIHFGIEEVDVANNNESSGLDYSIQCSKKWVPKSVRPAVLDALLAALTCILDKINQKKVTMHSFHKWLPEKALHKYTKISDLMVARGYEIKEDFVGNGGIRYWLYQRLPMGN